MRELTDKQRHVLDFIRDCIRLGGRPPTIRDICNHFGWTSTNGAADHLRALERKGYITIGPRSARNIKLTMQGTAATIARCPTCGQGI